MLFFRDHLTFLDEVLSEQKRKMGLLDLATQLKLKQGEFAARKGIRLHGELTDRKGVAFMSTKHIEPDLAAELFVLDEPFSETADIPVPSEDSGRSEDGHDRSPEAVESE